MVDNVVPTLAPKRSATEVVDSPRTQVKPISTDKETLFNSLAQESMDEGESAQSAFLKTFFTGLLWSGYAIAIVVAVVLVWSAAKEILH